MSNMVAIESLAADHSAARQTLLAIAGGMQAEIDAVQEKYADQLQAAAIDVRATHQALVEEITGNPQLFSKPRSVVIAGIKLGYRKQKGKTLCDDNKVVPRIRQHFPDMAKSLIKTTEKVVRTALANLSGADLKRLGVTIEADEDSAFAASAESDIEKLIQAYLAEE